MQETPTPEPIGSINQTYLGCLFLVWAMATGVILGAIAVYYFLH
jgi:hypothetical protein